MPSRPPQSGRRGALHPALKHSTRPVTISLSLVLVYSHARARWEPRRRLPRRARKLLAPRGDLLRVRYRGLWADFGAHLGVDGGRPGTRPNASGPLLESSSSSEVEENAKNGVEKHTVAGYYPDRCVLESKSSRSLAEFLDRSDAVRPRPTPKVTASHRIMRSRARPPPPWLRPSAGSKVCVCVCVPSAPYRTFLRRECRDLECGTVTMQRKLSGEAPYFRGQLG